MFRTVSQLACMVTTGTTIALGTGMGHRAAASIVISDSFTNNATNRAADESLGGVTAESGNATWAASRVAFTDHDTVAPSDDGASAWVDTPANPGKMTLEADLDAPDGSWALIYFTTQASTTGSDVYDDMQLLLRIGPGGGYHVTADGISVSIIDIADGTASNSNNKALNHVKLVYDPAQNTVSAYINSQTLVSDYDLDQDSFTPEIQTAGMFFNHHTGGEADNFKLTVAPVPEPGTMASMLGLLGLLGVAGVRRSRHSGNH